MPDAENDDLQDQLERLERGHVFMSFGRAVQVTFPTANVDTAVLHGAGAVPDGRLVLRDGGGVITDAPGVAWTTELAYLRSTVAASTATLVFVVLKEEPLNVAP